MNGQKRAEGLLRSAQYDRAGNARKYPKLTGRYCPHGPGQLQAFGLSIGASGEGVSRAGSSPGEVLRVLGRPGPGC
jgi:hypothetical protein